MKQFKFFKQHAKTALLHAKAFRAIGLIVFLNILPVIIYAQTIVFSSANPAISAVSLSIPSTRQPIYKARIILSGINGNGSNLTSITYAPRGTFKADDIINYELNWNTTDDLPGSTRAQNADAVTFNESGDQVTIKVNNPWFDLNTYYFWITADISSRANANEAHTIIVDALTPANFNFTVTGVTKSGTMYPGGTQTLVASGPNIIIGKETLKGFSYIEGFGPSAYQSYTLSGTKLTGDITISVPTNYEISTLPFTAYSNSLTLSPTAVTLASTTIYVRLKTGLIMGTYNSGIIAHTSTGATVKKIDCSGIVSCPVLPPVFTTPVIYCLGKLAVPLNASGANLLWKAFGNSSVGGTTNPTGAVYGASDNSNNRTTSFTVSSSVTSVNKISVDWVIPIYQSANNVQIAIQKSDGTTILNGTQSNAAITTTASVPYIQKKTAFFENLELLPGNYRIAIFSESGQFGPISNPTYPQTEPTGSINITGNSSNQLFFNLQFSFISNELKFCNRI